MIKQNQSGQAMMVAMVLMGGVILTSVFSFHVASIIKSKSTLLNAVDAAVFSVAQEQSSVLNTLSYLNRAQIAHQVALAHIVTMASAEQFRKKLSIQSSTKNPPVAVIGMLFGPVHASAYAASRIGAVNGLANTNQFIAAMMRHDQTVHRLINRAQHALVHNWSTRKKHVFEGVLLKNIKQSDAVNIPITMDQLGIDWRSDLDQMDSFIRFSSGQDEQWLAMLHAATSAHEYLKDRDYSVRNKWVISPRCPWRRHLLRRKGKTVMNTQGRWQAEDTLSYQSVRSNKWIGCYVREYPMGWSIVKPNHSSKEQNADAPRNFSTQAYWKWAKNRYGSNKKMNALDRNRLAEAWAEQESLNMSGLGMPDFPRLDAKEHVSSISTDFFVKQRLFQSLFWNAPIQRSLLSKWVAGWVDGLSISTYSIAKSTFSRPIQENHSKNQSASLFMPYWQASIATQKIIDAR